MIIFAEKTKRTYFMPDSIEFYVIAVFVAAAVIGLAARPHGRGAVRTFLYSGELSDAGEPSEAGIVAHVDGRGMLEIYRYGLEGLDAYSLAVKVSGFDVTIDERLTPGRRSGMPQTGYARIECLAAERYHIQYKSEATGRSAAFSLNIRPGNKIVRVLS